MQIKYWGSESRFSENYQFLPLIPWLYMWGYYGIRNLWALKPISIYHWGSECQFCKNWTENHSWSWKIARTDHWGTEIEIVYLGVLWVRNSVLYQNLKLKQRRIEVKNTEVWNPSFILHIKTVLYIQKVHVLSGLQLRIQTIIVLWNIYVEHNKTYFYKSQTEWKETIKIIRFLRKKTIWSMISKTLN